MSSIMYRVLARKYRPATFADLIGQEALVRTLSNAINSNRLAHAFILTGVRGVGKTTTARILARAMNCLGADGTLTQPTTEPCGVCENCTAIAEDRHVDVLEMDAASRTGVDDIREIIDNVRYKPVAARYKLFIIDEVHMLSKNAFNALLKTLEEPPPQVKFIFATTDIHKVPITVLSRCQRFDLPRVDRETLAKHLQNVATKEAVALPDDAAALLAKAAEGSVRDSLSLLDQAIALSNAEPISEPLVAQMLGLSDRTALYALYDNLMRGNPTAALAQFNTLYNQGAEPLAVLKELLEITHLLTRLKIDPKATGISTSEQQACKPLSDALIIPVLTRIWQILLKGYEEVRGTENSVMATEMVLIRLCYVQEVITPPSTKAPLPAGITTPHPQNTPQTHGNAALATQPPVLAMPLPEQIQLPQPQSFADVVALFEQNREARLAHHLKTYVRLVQFRPQHLEIAVDNEAPKDLAHQLTTLLSEWTKQRWLISITEAGNVQTLKEQADADYQALLATVQQDALVKKALEVFQGGRIVSVERV
jgi:DNA polymerase-3 subunit gamma/tau